MYDKKQVQFEHPAKGPHHCRACIHFLGAGKCAIVKGLVEPQDWCNQWKGNMNVKDTSEHAGTHEKAGTPTEGMNPHMHMEIHHDGKGGHHIHHVHHPSMSKSGAFMETKEPEVHKFPAGEHMAAHEHIAKHMGMPMEHEAMEEEPETGEL